MLLQRLTSRIAEPCCTRIRSRPSRACHRSITLPGFAFRQGDFALLRHATKQDAPPILTSPLDASGASVSHLGSVAHTDIIDKTPRETVVTSSGTPMRLHIPTLAEYVSMTPRLVTPIYAPEANLIVSLLDIHLPNHTEYDAREQMEILEAGTGHGSLTLHLARAIQSAGVRALCELHSFPERLSTKTLDQYRMATLHTVDVSAPISKHAQKIVRGFQRGMYANNVDFHVCEVPTFLEREFSRRGSSNPFLAAAVLDLPGIENYLESVSSALHVDALLAVFCPSITQIVTCFETCKEVNIPLWLDKVVELGPNLSSGREWDVRLFQPRASQRAEAGSMQVKQDLREVSKSARDQRHIEAKSQDITTSVSLGAGQGTMKTICHPKWGNRTTVGGFLGLFRKIREN